MEKKPKNRKGHNVTWAQEDFLSSGPGIFYNDISKMAKAFGEHLSPRNMTDLTFKIIEALTHEEKTICQAAGVLLLSFLEECCMDMEEIPKILREIYHHLPNISEPTTKQNTLKSVCHLASKCVKEVLDFLLERSPDCDQSAREIWRALTEDPYANRKMMRPLLKRTKTPFRKPTAGETANRPCQLRSAVRALKSLILCTGHLEEDKAVGKKGCWKMLVSPEAISHLVGTLFTFSTAQLKLMFRQTNTYLCHSDIKVKTIGMAFFSELKRWR